MKAQMRPLSSGFRTRGHRDDASVSLSSVYHLPLNRLLEWGPFHTGQFLYKSISYFYVITIISVHILKRQICRSVFEE